MSFYIAKPSWFTTAALEDRLEELNSLEFHSKRGGNKRRRYEIKQIRTELFWRYWPALRTMQAANYYHTA